ncbi:DUF4124 domain-containing protein [Leeia aquatica]|uniref:DUF4124 domain-containing protein n=1 Tax=Leeia aquatica TaxID=2725557 RepID=A0A847SAD5_9NEIS|nr:DUF4124 domain-containing protein [Leeia aquatica]NLR74299.1 DUF4124 domain-containing protein [Leeia aquatica]
MGLLLCLLTPAAHAAMYKCAINGKTTYSSTPCDGGQQQVMEAPSQPDADAEPVKPLTRKDVEALRSMCADFSTRKARALRNRFGSDDSTLFKLVLMEAQKPGPIHTAIKKTAEYMKWVSGNNPNLTEDELAITGNAYCVPLLPVLPRK